MKAKTDISQRVKAKAVKVRRLAKNQFESAETKTDSKSCTGTFCLKTAKIRCRCCRLNKEIIRVASATDTLAIDDNPVNAIDCRDCSFVSASSETISDSIFDSGEIDPDTCSFDSATREGLTTVVTC
eukprot:c4505_g1_i2.p2 GENE.c4505_g1_i2~~c4505_g1_i2.p2  ORF type:complete len:127 (+),score=32.87 c4505_g1_i2:70-450(+)